MNNKDLRWEILNKIPNPKSKFKINEIINVLLENRGIKTKKKKEEFFYPTIPQKVSLVTLNINKNALQKAIRRIEKAISKKEQIIIYGDYDADGICATAILWECLYSLTKNVIPYIPNRFDEGYGANAESIGKLKSQFPNFKLLITVDNGIVANEAIDKANELGIDVIITDHHQPRTALTSSRGLHPRVGGASMRGKKGYDLPKAYSIIHTDKISGSGIAWILTREILSKLPATSYQLQDSLELAAIGTIADQLPLLGPNRSFAKYGLEALNNTKRQGLLALFEEAGLTDGQTRLRQKATARQVGTYEVNFMIAPRINAMGRMEHAIDSLRLLCTKNASKARELANFLGRTNRERQRVVDEVVLHARKMAQKSEWSGAIVLAHESYHEGVIGLAASKLVEEFYRPVIVLSKGKKISKAPARSISGFNIIESIRKLDSITLGGGGHPMAAGFSIETEKIEIFARKFEEITSPLLTDDVLTKKLKVDTEVEFESLTVELEAEISKFEPTGIGNPAPVFITKKVSVVDAQTVGSEGKHLRLTLEKDDKIFNAIAFGKGEIAPLLSPNKKVGIAYNLSLDTWNGNKSLQLKVKDLKLYK